MPSSAPVRGAAPLVNSRAPSSRAVAITTFGEVVVACGAVQGVHPPDPAMVGVLAVLWAIQRHDGADRHQLQLYVVLGSRRRTSARHDACVMLFVVGEEIL